MFTIEKKNLTLGFMPLTDSAPVIIAHEIGFFEKWGLNVTLTKQNSWATLRDKLHYVTRMDGFDLIFFGYFDDLINI